MRRYYGSVLWDAPGILYEAGKRHNDFTGWVVLIASALTLVFPGLALVAQAWQPAMIPLTDWWPWGSAFLLLGLSVYGIACANLSRVEALEGRVASAESETEELRARLAPKLRILRKHDWPYIQPDPHNKQAVFHRVGIWNDSGATVHGVTVKVETCRPSNTVRPGSPFRIMDADLSDVVRGIEIAAGDTKYAEIVLTFEREGQMYALPHFARSTPADQPLGEGTYQLTVLVAGGPTDPQRCTLTLVVPRNPQEPVTLELV